MRGALKYCVHRVLASVLVIVGAIAANGATSARSLFPIDSGIVNVKDFGAKGDGRADDTRSIRAAILAASTDQSKFFWPAKIVYFPAGTYRLTDTISKRDDQGRYLASMALVGESMETVRLKLDNSAQGFDNAGQPKSIIYSSSTLLGADPRAGGKDYLGKGEGNDAYGNYVENITIDAGTGNRGAVGIDFLASNSGAIRNVRLVAAEKSGHIGISLDRKWPGPLLLMGVQVDGFDVGISVSHREYGVTLEDVVLTGQTNVALRNDGNVISMRNTEIETTAIGVQNKSPDGLIVIDRLTVKAEDSLSAWADNRGYITMKGVKAPLRKTGLRLPDLRAVPLNTTADGAYFGAQRLADFSARWKLPVRSAPSPWSPPVEQWANVAKFGAQPNSDEDAAPAIIAAMASGAEVIYFPSGRYKVKRQINVPPKIRRIAGMFSSIAVLPGATGVFRVGGSGDELTIERLTFDNMGRAGKQGVEHAGARTLVLRDVISAGISTVDRLQNGGPIFLENICCGPMSIAASVSGVWARQLNTEGDNVRITNGGAPLSILGVKVEQNATVVKNEPGAQTDIVGGLIYLVRPPEVQRPAFLNLPGAWLSLSYVETAYIDAAVYRTHVISGDKDHRVEVSADALPSRGRARIVPGIEVAP